MNNKEIESHKTSLVYNSTDWRKKHVLKTLSHCSLDNPSDKLSTKLIVELQIQINNNFYNFKYVL